MNARKIAKRLRHSLLVLRKEGFLSFLIFLLVTLQGFSRRRSTKHRQALNVVAKYGDIIRADPATPPPAWPGTDRTALTLAWIMPPPGKGSGGHMTLFRFIRYLEQAGHTCHIYLYTGGLHGDVAGVRLAMGNSFPVLKAPMKWLDTDADLEPADAIFATSWETAYASYSLPTNAKRYYFVQDFEPFFYQVGSHSVLAENTYRFNFHGITAGGWLAKRLHDDYGMSTDHFDFGSDSGIYAYNNAGPRREIAFYVRPFTERRGFEIGLMALDLFHRRHPDYVINLFGWDVSSYKIPFPFVNRSTLEVHELSALYDTCAAVLVLSFTNMSLLPLELLSSGVIPVVNDGDNNRMVSDNPYIAYAASNPTALAEALTTVVTRPDLPAYAKAASDSVKSVSWDDSGRNIVEIVERETPESGRLMKFITVFIPTFNGELFLEECLRAILGQKLPEGYELELLVIDSGSSDRTLDILGGFADRLTLHAIPNSEFSHGGTRDKAVRLAKGEFILLLSQDATPAHDRWLLAMIEPFFISPKVGCVFGAQVPRATAAATIKREVSTAFRNLGTRDSVVIHRPDSLVDGQPVNGLNTFFSDANSAVRRDLVTTTVPFRQVNYAEDQALAKDMQEHGYLKAYAPQAEVMHSNTYTAREYYYRKFDESIGLQESVNQASPRSRRALLTGWIRPTVKDWQFTLADPDYSRKRKLKNLLEAPLYEIGLQKGLYYSSKYLNDPAKRREISLEHKLRS